ncbi:MAG: hypothetical protein LBG72_01200 [Spirochaetaceae bacterium]|jgi:hypothetical protein|nr:hypothetical protein [Spirochaetaceae bacterium]
MAEMTEEEADALDELWTKTTPKIKVGAGGGFFSKHRAQMVLLDEQTARILNAKAMSVRQTPSEFVTQMIRSEIVHTRHL